MAVQTGGADPLRYDLMLQRALRSVLREALHEIAENGLPGEHHLYITFRTTGEGVVLPDHLLQRYPDEMTIVLQHEFWGLEVEQAGFAVTLSFGGKAERLSIPFEAVVAFADPSVRFGLQFQASSVRAEEGDEAIAEEEQEDGDEEERAGAEQQADSDEDEPGKAKEKDEPDVGAKVVTLDRFRRK